MELRYRREALVGVLIVVAAAVFFYMMLWLRGKSLRGGETVRAAFADVAGLKEGDPVRTSGVKVGQVQHVELTAPGRVTVTAAPARPDPPSSRTTPPTTTAFWASA